MIVNRRHFLGAVAAGTAGLVAPRYAEAVVPVGVDGISGGSELPTLLPRAMAALQMHGNSIQHRDVIGLVDFSAPSRMMRFHLFDLATGKIVASHLVAHGRGSDPDNSGFVERLSNRPGSNASCSGAFVTGDTYYGKHGHSRRVSGLDPENSLASSRGIVIHAASYVDREVALSQGRVGRSQGCFAVSQNEIGAVLTLLGPGRLLYASK